MTDAIDPSQPEDSSSGADDSVPRIGSFRITGVVSRGDHSTLYRATDETLERDVALKVIAEPSLADRLVAEARATSKLQHPAIASVYSAGIEEASGVAYVAYEWVEGIPLRSRIRGPRPYLEFLRLAEEICSAVAYAHDQGLVHGDLKADNVVLTVGEERAKLIDFGLSRSLSLSDSPPDDDDSIWGTPAYMAPELFEGSPRSVQSDLFALGVLLYELATGELPFGGTDGDVEAVRRAHSTPVRSPSEFSSEFPLSACSRIESLLDLDPQRRGPTAAEVSRWAAQEHIRRTRRRAARFARVVLPIVAICGLAAWYSFRDQKTAETDTTPAGVELSELPARVRVGVWFDDRGEPSPEVDFGIELLRLFLHGEDPGSAIARANRRVGKRESSESERAAWVCGRWARDASGLSASFVVSELPNDTPGADATFLRADDAVSLARSVAEHIANLDLAAEVTVADTLGDSVSAIEEFIRGVELSSQGRLIDARAIFESVAASAESCVEARSWARACALALGDIDAARWPAGDPVPRSNPGRLLTRNFRVPRRMTGERWEASHPLAEKFDLALDLADPSTPDRELLEALSDVGRGENPTFARTLAELELVRGDLDAARQAVTRLKAWVGESDPMVRLLEWRLDAANGNRSPRSLFRWLARLEDRDFRYWCSIGIELQQEDFARAVISAAVEPPVPSLRSRVAAATARMLFDEPVGAIAAAQSIVDPLDPGRGARIEAAVHMLTGDVGLARASLLRAKEREPDQPMTNLLIDVVQAKDPADVKYEPLEFESEFERLRRPFLRLSAARRLRTQGDPEAALDALQGLAFTRSGFEPVPWPEIILLARVERIHALIDAGNLGPAKVELETFRELWPSDRAPLSRVESAAKSAQARIDSEVNQ